MAAQASVLSAIHTSCVDGAAWGRRKESFDAAAADYAALPVGVSGPGCRRCVVASALRPGSRVLEIRLRYGPAQRSRWLSVGPELVAVDSGSNLAAIARRNLAAFPAARVEVSGFEEWPLPADTFDVVVAASALHWIDPAVRFSKPALALRRGGVLVVVHVGSRHGRDARVLPRHPSRPTCGGV